MDLRSLGLEVKIAHFDGRVAHPVDRTALEIIESWVLPGSLHLTRRGPMPWGRREAPARLFRIRSRFFLLSLSERSSTARTFQRNHDGRAFLPDNECEHLRNGLTGIAGNDMRRLRRFVKPVAGGQSLERLTFQLELILAREDISHKEAGMLMSGC